MHHANFNKSPQFKCSIKVISKVIVFYYELFCIRRFSCSAILGMHTLMNTDQFYTSLKETRIANKTGYSSMTKCELKVDCVFIFRKLMKLCRTYCFKSWLLFTSEEQSLTFDQHAVYINTGT